MNPLLQVSLTVMLLIAGLLTILGWAFLFTEYLMYKNDQREFNPVTLLNLILILLMNGAMLFLGIVPYFGFLIFFFIAGIFGLFYIWRSCVNIRSLKKGKKDV